MQSKNLQHKVTKVTKKISTASVTPKVPWRVVGLQVLSDYRLAVEFVDGTKGEVDLSRLVNSTEGGVFRQLQDRKLFDRAYLDLGAVAWPGEIDLAPDAMYDAIRAEGRWIVE